MSDQYKILRAVAERQKKHERSLDRIDREGAIRELRSRGLDVVSASEATLGQGNLFTITGTTTINYITSFGWTSGSVVILEFEGALTLTHQATGTPSSAASLSMAGGVDLAVLAGERVMFMYDGTYWVELSRPGSAASLCVGIDDDTAGTLCAYGDRAGSDTGGQGIFYMSADHDGTYEYWRMFVQEDDLRIGPEGATLVTFTPTRIGIGTTGPSAKVQIVNNESSTTAESGLQVSNTFSPSSAPTNQFPAGVSILSQYDSSSSEAGSGFILGAFLDVRNLDSGVTNARVVDVLYRNNGSGTVAQAEMLRIRTPINDGGGAITTVRAIYIENQTVGTTNYAIFTNQGDISLMSSASDALGFHGATPVAQQTVTGSRGGNAALANLLTALANLGLIVDSTT